MPSARAHADIQAGSVVSVRPAPDLFARAQLVEYRTTLENGQPTVAAATIFEPSVQWMGKGQRPTLVFAPGTRGQGDQCAPSRADFHIASAGSTFLNIDYDYQSYLAALALGMRVVVPDYIGLGTPGLHSYVNNIEQAHALADAARASLILHQQAPDSPVGFAGYSQGGGAAAAAAEYAASYAPELNVKGTFAGAPPADLKSVIAQVDGSAIVHVLAYAANGFNERDPRFGQALFPLLNSRGKDFFSSATTSCITDSMVKWGLTKTSSLTTTGESLSQIIERSPVLRETLERQSLGKRGVTGPIMIANSPTDDLIPYGQARALAGAYCQAGSTVQFIAEPSYTLVSGDGVGHALPILSAVPRGLEYLYHRFNDEPAPSNCK